MITLTLDIEVGELLGMVALIDALSPALHNALRQSKDVQVLSLEMTVRTTNALEKAGIVSIDQLVKMKKRQVMQLPNLGRKSFRELEEVLAIRGLSLAP